MSLITARSAQLSSAPRHRYWRSALVSTVALATALFALVPATSATAAPSPVRTAAAGRMPADRTNIEQKVCNNGGWDTWVHLYPTEGALCYGFQGTWSLSGYENFYWYCPGNNKGYLTLTDSNGTFRRYFSPGQGLQEMPAYLHEDSITITGWEGSATCPPA
jgi:hypothetical protein